MKTDHANGKGQEVGRDGLVHGDSSKMQPQGDTSAAVNVEAGLPWQQRRGGGL